MPVRMSCLPNDQETMSLKFTWFSVCRSVSLCPSADERARNHDSRSVCNACRGCMLTSENDSELVQQFGVITRLSLK